MAKKAYVGVNGAARKIKRGYIGVDGKARKIKKAYIGVGGVARPCWSGGELTYYGEITGLSKARYGLAAVSFGNYAIFGSTYHHTQGDFISAADAYSKSLTRSSVEASQMRMNVMTAAVGEYGLFAGGFISGDNTPIVNAYNQSLTKTTPTGLIVNRPSGGGTAVGNYALFGGGGPYGSTYVDAYDTSLTRSNPTGLSVKRGDVGAASVGKYALFCGGTSGDGGVVDVVDAYDTALTRSSPAALLTKKQPCAASVGKYALIGPENYSTAELEAYDTSLTRISAAGFTEKVADAVAVSSEYYALFGGGHYTVSGTQALATVFAYDASLTRSAPTGLNTARYSHAAASVGDFILFGGGQDGSANPKSSVEAYSIA